jgi:hypothetical protein
VRIVGSLPMTHPALAGGERERTQRRGSTCVRIVRLLELSNAGTIHMKFIQIIQ